MGAKLNDFNEGSLIPAFKVKDLRKQSLNCIIIKFLLRCSSIKNLNVFDFLHGTKLIHKHIGIPLCFLHCNPPPIACSVIHIRKFSGLLCFQFSVRSGWIEIIKVPFQARTSYPCNNIPILRHIFCRFHVGHLYGFCEPNIM